MREAMSVNGNISAGGEIRGTVSGTGAVHGSVSGHAPIHGSTGGMKVLHTDSYAIAVANGFVGTVDEWLESLKGHKGDPGADGGYYTPSVEQVNDSTMRISFSASKEGMPVVEDLNIALLPGKDGAEGISPVVAVEDIDGGHRVTITDKDGAKQFDVMDGKDGEDGFSPEITGGSIDGGHRLIITDKNGTRIMDIMDGKDGNDGVHWDNVEGKPFGEIRPDTLYWDGNTEGLLEIASDVGNFYKVSDVVLTEDDFFKTWSYEYDIVRISGDSGVIFSETNDDVLDAMFAELGFGIIGDWVFCAPTDNYEIPAFGITLPEAGVYFNANYNIRSFHIADFTRFPSTKLMDTKYLPMDDITAAVIAALPVYDGEVVTE